SVFNPATGSFAPNPIDLSPAGDRVFLVLYCTGVRKAADPNGDGNLNETVRALIGGVEVTPLFVGPQGGFVGLDQINLEIPRSLIGRGLVSLAITAAGFSPSNLAEIGIASPQLVNNSPPQVISLSLQSVLAGQKLEILGSNFSPNKTDNQVQIVDA